MSDIAPLAALQRLVPSPAFLRCLAVLWPEEGGYTNNPADPGNWTGGAVGRGECRGTNFGISAKKYPNINIRGLSREEAAEIYYKDYFLLSHCDKLPPPLALLVFDCAVNGGLPIKWLQQAVGVAADGEFGPKTLAAVNASAGHGSEVCAAFQSAHLSYLAGLSIWPTFKGGWIKRQVALCFHAARMT